MSRPLLRALLIPKGHKTDAEGLAICDDWLIWYLDPACVECDGGCDTCKTVAVTTDRVRTSEYGAMVPGTQHGLARMFAEAVNELVARTETSQEWQERLARWDAPVPKPRRAREPRKGPRLGELTLFTLEEE